MLVRALISTVNLPKMIKAAMQELLSNLIVYISCFKGALRNFYTGL